MVGDVVAGRTVLLGGCLVAATVLGLTGCDQNMAQGPAAIQRDGDDLVVVVCEDIDVRSVLVETWGSGDGTPTEIVLEASGSAPLQAGFRFSTGQGVDGLVTQTRTSPSVDPGANIAVQILASGSTEGDINATFTVGQDGLSGSLWLHPDGRETDVPCW
jgi:hypothetical protein